MNHWNTPYDDAELFSNGEQNYSITDPNYPGDNIFGMNLFIHAVGIPPHYIEEDYGTQIIVFDGETRLQIDCGGLGDFHLHGFEVTVVQ